MAQTIAKFVEFDRKEQGTKIKNPYAIWKMENREGWFWASFTEKGSLNVFNAVSKKAEEKKIKGKLVLLSGYWKYTDYAKKDGRKWEGWSFKVSESYPVSSNFWLTSWETLPEKSLREIE